jgi:hypothetical protein
MLDVEGVIVKKGGGEFLQDLADNLPISRTEVSAEGLTTREEKLIRDNVREGTHDVWVEFYLAEG